MTGLIYVNTSKQVGDPEHLRAPEGVNSSTLPIAVGSHLEGPNRSGKFVGIIRIGRRWFGRAHEFGLSSIR